MIFQTVHLFQQLLSCGFKLFISRCGSCFLFPTALPGPGILSVLRPGQTDPFPADQIIGRSGIRSRSFQPEFFPDLLYECFTVFIISVIDKNKYRFPFETADPVQQPLLVRMPGDTRKQAISAFTSIVSP